MDAGILQSRARAGVHGHGWLYNRRGHWLNIIGRLRPGLILAQTRASLEPLHRSTLEK